MKYLIMVLIITNFQGTYCEGHTLEFIQIILLTSNSTDTCWEPSIFQALIKRCVWSDTKSYEHSYKAVEEGEGKGKN